MIKLRGGKTSQMFPLGFKGLYQSWNRFWFEADGSAQITLFRICLGILLFFFYVVRSLDLELFYTDAGMLRLLVLPDLVPMRFRFSLFSVFTSHEALWAFN